MFKSLLVTAALFSSFTHASSIDLDVTRIAKAKCPGSGFQILLPKLDVKNSLKKSLKSNLNSESISIYGQEDLNKELTFSAYMSFFKCMRGDKTFIKREMIPSIDNFAISRANFDKVAFGEFEKSMEVDLAGFTNADLKEMLIQTLHSANRDNNPAIRKVLNLNKASVLYYLNKYLDYEKAIGDKSVLISRGEINFKLSDILTLDELQAIEEERSFTTRIGLTVSRTIPYNIYLEYNADKKKINLFY